MTFGTPFSLAYSARSGYSEQTTQRSVAPDEMIRIKRTYYFETISKQITNRIFETFNNYKIYNLESKIHELAQIRFIQKA